MRRANAQVSTKKKTLAEKLASDEDWEGKGLTGLFLSNGPGDPSMCSDTVRSIQYVMEHYPTKPIFGICLGNQLLALASGAITFKMCYGNRGMNQPCIDLRTGRCYITPQVCPPFHALLFKLLESTHDYSHCFLFD